MPYKYIIKYYKIIVYLNGKPNEMFFTAL